jgi:hypothetical protein
LARPADPSAESEVRSPFDRLIEALQPHSVMVAPDVQVDVVYLDPEHGQVVLMQARRDPGETGASERGHAPPVPDTETVHRAILRALTASKQREAALSALARALLEQLRDESVSELADLLDKSVEELEAARGHAAQVEGEREPDDPQEILKVLPKQYHEWFLADYREALRTAYPAGGFLGLTRVLHKWRLRAEQYADPAYQKSLDEARMARARSDRPPGWRSAEDVRDRLRERGRPA